MENIKLNFINKSDDIDNSSIVIFEKNEAEDFDEFTIAWKVIENCGRLDNHTFTYPLNFKVSASDSYGNHTPQLTAYDGQRYDMVKDPTGDVLRLSTVSTAAPTEIEVRNNLQQGAINANCYRDGKLTACKTGIAPGEEAVFEFHPRIYIGAISQITEGDIMSSAIISQINTEIDLFGISSADIVMTGGGNGPNPQPFKFSLENIKK